MFTVDELQRGIYATSTGTGPFHPAIRIAGRDMVWPNVSFESEDEAYNWAFKAIGDAMQPALDVINQWNIWPVV